MTKISNEYYDINNIGSTLVKCISIAVLVAIVFRHIVCYDVNLFNLLVFAVFVFFFVQIQGLGIVNLFKIRFGSLSGKIMTGFFIGFAANIVEYYLSVFFHSNLFFFVGCGAAIGYLLWGAIKQKRCFLPAFRISSTYYVLVALLLLLSMMDVQLTYIRPDISNVSNVDQDYLYHMSLINSISNSFPINNPDLFGETIHYHFFSDLIYAIPVRVFGLSSKFVVFDCMPYLNTFIVSLSLYSFYHTAIDNRKMSGAYSLLTLCSFASIPLMINGNMVLSDGNLLGHVVTNINAMGLGLSSACCFISNFIEFERTEDCGRGLFIRIMVLCLLMALVVGIKAPIGIVIIAALWGSIILGLFFGIRSSKILASLLLISVIGILVYCLIVGSDNGAGATIGFFFKEKAKAMPLWIPISTKLIEAHVPVFVIKLLLSAIYILILLGVYCVVFTIAYVRELILVFNRTKPYVVSKVLVYAIIPVAFIIYEVVIFPDYHSSELYFLFIASSFIPLVTFWFIEDIKERNNVTIEIIKIIFVVCSCVGIVAMLLFINTHFSNGIYNIKSNNQYDIVTSAEYEGLCWIKDNTPKDSLLAVDRYQRVAPENYDYLTMHHNTFFGYSAYSQRNCFLEGSGYTLRVSRSNEITKWTSINNRFFDPADSKRGELARQIGIDYVIVSKRLHPIGSLENEDYTLCFRNKDIDIYIITK